MARKNDKVIYVCSECGDESIVYSGRCQSCGSWNTLKEFRLKNDKSQKLTDRKKESVSTLSQIESGSVNRIETGISEFDRVLGGGFVKGSLILFAGEPGIGKSTLLSQVSAMVKKTLYVSAEESLAQIKTRYDRLKLGDDSLKLVTETDLDNIEETVRGVNPELLIIDSIQTISSVDFPSTAGSLIQVRECALRIQNLIKSLGVVTILVGHVTKGGEVAGPRTLEHLVDVVLYLEGERYHDGRILRGIKNRFGPTDEVGIFQIGERGLKEVLNPSELFLKERQSSSPGTAIAVTLEGTRPILVEVQALTVPTSFGYPRRTVSGYDLNRLNIIIAILSRRTPINLSNHDVYVNITGGLKINEPAIDLAIAMAIVSAYKNKPVLQKSCFYGELGLTGEIRKVLKEERRQKEAEKLGFRPVRAKDINQIIKQI